MAHLLGGLRVRELPRQMHSLSLHEIISITENVVRSRIEWIQIYYPIKCAFFLRYTIPSSWRFACTSWLLSKSIDRFWRQMSLKDKFDASLGANKASTKEERVKSKDKRSVSTVPVTLEHVHIVIGPLL